MYNNSLLLYIIGFNQEIIETVNLSLPIDYIPGSERANVKIIGEYWVAIGEDCS